jgi:hypothetical protein
MEDAVRVQVDVQGTRVWVAAAKTATIGQLMVGVAASECALFFCLV